MKKISLILDNNSWEDLSLTDKLLFHNNRNEYDKQIILISLKHQIRYEGNLIKTVIKNQKKYYECLIEYAIEEMMLYPYHLQDKISPGLSIRPFDYYKIIVKDLLLNEKPYDSMPNFTAVDCKNILGIGRNEYIELMNNVKSRNFLKQNLSIETLLPSAPNMIELEPWFAVRNDAITSQDISLLSNEEKTMLDKIIDKTQLEKPLLVSSIDQKIIQKLHSKMMIYFDVPILDEDHFYIVTLNNFIMNRISGDHCESLLYKVFLSLDHDYSMKELAMDLDISIASVKQAVSIFSRLGYAKKLDQTPKEESEKKKKIAFLYDSTMTAFLMMGNVSQSLKKHAITMFEVGRLTFESLDSLLDELVNLESLEEEGEAQMYALHAINLGKSIRLIREYCRTSNNLKELDLIKIESLNALDENAMNNILKKHYDVLISMAPITFEDLSKFDINWPSHYGPTSPNYSSPWFNLFILNHVNEYINKNFSVFKEATKKQCQTLPMMILARGKNLNELPQSFYPYSRCRVTTWGHDPAIMTTNSVVFLVNELVQSNPIFIQGFDKNEVDAPQKLLFISLPLKSGIMKNLKAKFKSAKSIGKKDKLAYVKMILLALNDLVSLENTCGYISFVEQKSGEQINSSNQVVEEEFGQSDTTNQQDLQFNNIVNSMNKFDPEKNVVIEYEEVDNFLNGTLTKENFSYNNEYQLYSLNVGLAMFNANLNDSILKGMLENGLFKSAQIQKNHEMQISVNEKLNKFIQLQGGISPRDLSRSRTSLVNKNVDWSLPSKSFSIGRDSFRIKHF